MLFIAPRASISTCSTPGDVGHLSQLRGGFLGHFMSFHTKTPKEKSRSSNKNKKNWMIYCKCSHSIPSNFWFLLLLFLVGASWPWVWHWSCKRSKRFAQIQSNGHDPPGQEWSLFQIQRSILKMKASRRDSYHWDPENWAESDTMISGYIWFSKNWVWKKFAIPLASKQENYA